MKTWISDNIHWCLALSNYDPKYMQAVLELYRLRGEMHENEILRSV